jgi:hypothetical protein
MSTAFTKQIQQVTDTDGIIMLLEVTCPAFTAPLHIVNDTRDWTSNGQVYTGYPFGFTLPNDTSGETPRTQLVIDNVGRGLTNELERVGPNQLVMAKLMIASRRDPNQIERTFALPMASVSVSPTRASATCGMDYLMRQQAMNKRFTPELTPGLY